MSEIKVEKLTDEQLDKMGVWGWPVWGKEASRFDWHYDHREQCYLLEGRVTVEAEGQKVTFGAGDFVTFPAGLTCVWEIHEPVRKHYKLD
jgi:uncharacterized cupin superfamily protein